MQVGIRGFIELGQSLVRVKHKFLLLRLTQAIPTKGIAITFQSYNRLYMTIVSYPWSIHESHRCHISQKRS